jgi:hypothetical protein
MFKRKFWGKGYARSQFCWLDYGFNAMKIPVMEAAAHKHLPLLQSEFYKKNWTQMTETYLRMAF